MSTVDKAKPSDSTSPTAESEIERLTQQLENLRKENEDLRLVRDKSQTSADYYWDSYAHFGIHEEMIKDDVRTKSYQKAIMNNRHTFEGKVVMDVGAGSGILSLFAAKAGAAKVIAVECSSVVDLATEVIQVNGYENVIKIVKGKVEEIETLPDGIEKVDVIISEWMGYCLLYESMLNSVLFARDKWLKPDGAMFPSHANLYAAGIEDAEYKDTKINFWDNVYGFNFSPFKRLALLEPLVEVSEPDQVCTSVGTVIHFDLHTCTVEDLNFKDKAFQLSFKRKDSIHALLVWFDVEFNDGHSRIVIPTGPFDKYTHWKQVVFYLEKVLLGHPGESLDLAMSIQSNKANFRDLDIKLSVDFRGKVVQENFTQDFRLR